MQPFVTVAALSSRGVLMGKLVAGAIVVAAFTAVQAPRPSTDVSYSRQTLIQFGVSNLDRAIEFYTKVLGFTLAERRDDLQFAHIETNVPGLQIGLNAVPDAKGTGSAILNIGVTDIVAARRVLEGRGVVFRGETQIIPGKVSLAMFADPDGNALRLAGPAPRR